MWNKDRERQEQSETFCRRTFRPQTPQKLERRRSPSVCCCQSKPADLIQSFSAHSPTHIKASVLCVPSFGSGSVRNRFDNLPVCSNMSCKCQHVWRISLLLLGLTSKVGSVSISLANYIILWGSKKELFTPSTIRCYYIKV